MKKCKHCGEVKYKKDYYKDKNGKDGLRANCKGCIRAIKLKRDAENPVLTVCKNTGWGIIRRVQSAKYSPFVASYRDKGIKSKIGDTGTAIGEYLYKHYYDEIKDLLDKGIHPSINRIDPDGHYEEGNIEFISYSRNAYLGAINAGKASRKPVIVEFPDGTTHKYGSIKAATESIGASAKVIRTNRDNKTKDTKGRRFYDV